MDKKKLEFYVLCCGFMDKDPYMFNIFDNIVVRNDIIKFLKKNPSKEELMKELDAVCLNQFMGRYEYEIDVKQHDSDNDFKRVDVYQQVKPNIEIIAEYLLNS